MSDEPFEKIEILRRGDKMWVRVHNMNTGKTADWHAAGHLIPQIIDAIGDSPEYACGLDINSTRSAA